MEEKIKPIIGLLLLVLTIVMFWVVFNPLPRNFPNIG